ncbi:MAG: T9SS type A sorting domain-containing protein [Bacteroidales bacterium]|nr:T9SS type A sorting domain-containing protein [Bacteroidales bacterium]
MRKTNFTRLLIVTVLALFANVMIAQTYTYPVKGKQGFSVSQKTRDGMHISYELGQFTLNQMNYRGEEMSEISISTIALPNNAGSPNLPTESRMIAIPTGAQATLNVVSYDMEVIKNVNIAPALPVQAEVEEPDMNYTKDMSIYAKDALYPENPFIIGSSYIRGVDAVTVAITPFQYNPVTKDLVVYSNIELSLTYEGGNGHFGEDRLRSQYWDPILAAELVNYDQLPVIDYEARMQQWLRDGADGAEYLIITPNNDAWAPYAQQLKEFRMKQGIITEIYRLDEMPATTTNMMKEWFHNAYDTWTIAPVAVCLLGDHNTNMAQGIPAETTSHPYNGSCITDNFYADAAGDDNLPDMVFSRLVAQNASELPIFVGKQIEYEYTNVNTDPSFYNGPVTALGWQTERWFQICSEVFGGYMRNHGYFPIRINCPYQNSTVGNQWSTNSNTQMVVDYFGPSGLNYIPSNPQDLGGFTGGTPDQVVTAVNNGIFWLQHRDHGYNEGWGEPSVSNSHIDQMTNVNKLPFVMSINCQTGQFNYTGSNGNCFAEKWMRRTYNGQNAGAVGVLCPTEVSYSFVNDAFVWGVYDLFDGQFMPDYGPFAENTGNWMPAFGNVAGKYFLAQSSWPSNPGSKDITYTMFTAHCDAFLRIFTQVPGEMPVTHQNVQLAGLNTFQITAPEGAMIALTTGDGEDLEIIAVAEATGSIQNLEIVPQVPPTVIRLTVTGQNYLRYEANIDVIPATGPYVIIDSYELGYEATQLNFGEDASFNIQLKNVGSSQAPAGTMTLTTESEYVTITNGTADFTAINADDTFDLDEAFTFSVSDEVPNKTNVSFTIMITSGSDTYENHITLKAYAPSFEIGNVGIREIANGNGNGRMDPGETVKLRFPVSNVGNADSWTTNATLTYDPIFMELLTSPTVSLESIEAGGSSYYDFEILVGNAPAGYAANYSLSVESGVYTDSKEFSSKIGLNVEDFEAGSLNTTMWTNNSAIPWTFCTEEPYEGTRCMKSGAISHSQQTELSLTYEAGANDSIAFYYKVSSESGWDKLYFYIDNTEMGVWSGTVDWTRAQYPVTTGTHTFKWKYQKDSSVSNGSDCAWIDFVILPVDRNLSVSAGPDVNICVDEAAQLNGFAANQTSLTWTTAGDGTFDDATSLNAIYTPGTQDIANGGVTLTLTATMGAQTMSDNLELSFIAEPVASGTESQTAMTLDPIEVEVEIENLGVFTGWETSGSGTFANPMALQTTYTPSNGDYELVDIVLTATFTGCGYKTYTFEVNVHFAQDAVISLNEATMSIHPNPTNDVLNIAVDNISSRIDITIYNSVGQMVYYKSDAAENGYNSTISLGDLSNGTYILQVRSDENVWTERIIKR